MGTQARLTPALVLLSFLTAACGESGEEASIPARPKKPQVDVETTSPAGDPTTDVPIGPGFAPLENEEIGTVPQGGPEMPPDFDLAALLNLAEERSEEEVSGPEPAELPADPSGYLVGVIRMRGMTVFLKLEGTTSQLATAILPMRRACQSFEVAGGEPLWTVPPSLDASFGEQGAMVPASLTLNSDPAVRGTVTVLGGDGGGLEASVLGWLRQLKRPLPTEEKLTAFLRRQERFLSQGGLDVVIVDLSQSIE